MVTKVYLNDTPIQVTQYQEYTKDGFLHIAIDFKVTSQEYHDIVTLLYEGTFDVKIPEKNLSLRATIHQFYTSVTNLYEENQVGEYHVLLREVIKEER